MATYRVLERSYLPDGRADGSSRIFEAGEEFHAPEGFNASPQNLEPTSDDAREKQGVFVAAEEKRRAALSPQPGDQAFSPEDTALLANLIVKYGTHGVPVPADVSGKA